MSVVSDIVKTTTRIKYSNFPRRLDVPLQLLELPPPLPPTCPPPSPSPPHRLPPREAMSGLSVEPVETGCDLRIATLPKAHVQSAMFSLLSLLFFNDKEEGRFVSVTCVQQMITLVADASSLSLVPGLEVDPTAWSVLRVDSVLDVVGAIASLTRPLARAGIPVFHLSTYDSEFVLVPRAHLSVALSCFSSDPSRSPPLMGDDRSSGELDSVSAPRERAFALNILDSHRTTILRLERQYEPWHLHALLRLLFFSEPEDPEPAVVNLTWSPDNELSILAGESVCPSRTACTPPAFLACFDHDCRSDAMVDGALQHVPCWALRHPAGASSHKKGTLLPHPPWHACAWAASRIKRESDCATRIQEEMVPISLVAGLNETGVVATMATILSSCDISILGCSTLLGGILSEP